MAPSRDAFGASETTSLLGEMPSAVSTEKPTRRYSGATLPLASSYEDVRDSVTLELQALNQTAPYKDPTTTGVTGMTAVNRRNTLAVLVLGCVLSGVFVAIRVFNRNHSRAVYHLPVHPEPFSILDPVKDLGLLEFHRESSLPPENIFRKLNVDTSGKRSALPTNAWYQNMLLSTGEPSNIHRAYATPYMLDAVGLIPGLRIHPNHIESSVFVMQLSFLDSFGLTLGATGDVTKGKHETNSKAYSVRSTTQLGLTLEWVRNTITCISCDALS